MIRKIYEINAYTKDGELLHRTYARNMKMAKRIAKPYGDLAVIRLLDKSEWFWAYVNKNDIK